MAGFNNTAGQVSALAPGTSNIGYMPPPPPQRQQQQQQYAPQGQVQQLPSQVSSYPTSSGGGGSSSSGAFGQQFQGSSFQPVAFPTGVPSQVNYTPTHFDTKVQENPQIAALQTQMGNYRGGLAAGNDADAQLAMGRQRDLASGMAKEGLQGALDRGFGAETGYAQQRRLKGLDAGQSAAAGLNASLTSDARRQQMNALQNEGGLAVQQAGVTQGQQNFNLGQWQAQNSAALNAAQFAGQQQQNQFQNQFNVANAQNSQQLESQRNQVSIANLYQGL